MKISKWAKATITLGISTMLVALVLIGVGVIQFSGKVSDQSVLADDVLVIESNQTAVDKFLDTNRPFGLKATETVGIEARPIIVDSDGKKYPLDSGFLKLPSATLTDKDGRLLDLGQFHVGFFAVTDNEDKLIVLAKYRVELNGKTLIERDLFGSGKTTNKALQLESNGLKTFGFDFKDEPGDVFVVGEDANILRVFVSKIDATVGTNVETSKRFMYEDEFPIITIALSYDGDKKVIRDYTGKAVSVFNSDTSLKTCGYAYLYRVNVGPYGHGGEQKQEYVYPPSTMIYAGDKLLLTGVADPSTAPSSGEVSNGWKDGQFCSVFGGIPRDTLIKFVVNGQSFELKTGKTQEIHTIQCSATSTIGYGQPIGKTCSSSFGFKQ